jgi:undecaprenyl-diphosphatase
VTEFLPISSSGHLVVAEKLLKFGGHGPFEEITLHVGTLVAVAVFFRRDLGRLAAAALAMARNRGDKADPHRRLVWLVLAGTAATAIVFLAGRRFFEESFDSLPVAGLGFLVTGLALLLTRLVRLTGERRAVDGIGLRDALWIGLAQGLSITPGISRSGATISAALLRGLDADVAVRFSFLLGVPAILGGALVEARHLFGPEAAEKQAQLLPLFFGTLASFVVGYASLRLLVLLTRRGFVGYFAYYCFGIGVVTLFSAWLW